MNAQKASAASLLRAHVQARYADNNETRLLKKFENLASPTLQILQNCPQDVKLSLVDSPGPALHRNQII
jgi:hypothetical protein